jgi:hypothetical protein
VFEREGGEQLGGTAVGWPPTASQRVVVNSEHQISISRMNWPDVLGQFED